MAFCCFEATALEVKVSDEVNAANKLIASEWRAFNRNVDRFFTNQNYRVSENKSSVAAFISSYKREGEKASNEYDLQLKIDLPRTTKKLKLVIEKEQDEVSRALSDDVLTKKTTVTRRGAVARTAKSKYTAGVNYILSQTKEFSSLVKFGLRLDLPLNPYAKFNIQKEYDLGRFTLDLSQDLLLYRQAGFQTVSQVSLNRKWSEVYHTDFLNSLVWTDESDALILRNNLILYQDLGGEKLLSYSVGTNARFSPVFHYDKYDVSVSYRQLLYNKWLYGILTLGAEFPKAENFDDHLFAQIRFEVFFK